MWQSLHSWRVLLCVLVLGISSYALGAQTSSSSSVMLDPLTRQAQPLWLTLESLVSTLPQELDSFTASLQTQKILDRQRLVIDSSERAIKAIASSIAGAGGDLRTKARAIAEGFRHLYSLYHPGGS
jgi:hypothetical protein